MNAKHWMILGLLAAAGCADTSTDSDTSATDTGTTDSDTGSGDDDTGEFVDACEGVEVGEGLVNVTGYVYDTNGDTVGGAQVNMCDPVTCITVRAQENGRYCYSQGLEASDYLFYVKKLGSTDEIAIPNRPYPLDGDEGTVTLDATLIDWTHDAELPAAATEIELGEGLFLTVGAGDINDVTGSAFSGQLHGAKVSTDDGFDVSADFPGVDVLGYWYLAPFQNVAADEGGIPIRLTGFGGTDGTAYDVYVARYGEWELLGSPVQAEGSLSPAAGVPEITAVVVTRAMDR